MCRVNAMKIDTRLIVPMSEAKHIFLNAIRLVDESGRELLDQFANDKKQGDDGGRAGQCRGWAI